MNEIGKERGMTMIELVIAMVIAAIILVSMVPFFHVNINSYVQAKKGKETTQSARVGFNRMSNDLVRLTSSLFIDVGTLTAIRFDLPTENDIVYMLYNGKVLRKGVKLIKNVSSLEFHYYTEDGTEKTVPFLSDSDVWRIEMEMVVDDGINTVTFKKQISPRNIHFE